MARPGEPGAGRGRDPVRRVDCHAHVIDPARFPYAEGPGYRPRADETGDRAAFARALTGAGVGHALLVQPSCYGTDNACMLDAMAEGGGRIKGVAVVSRDATDRELLALGAQGIVGIRLHLVRSCPDALTRPDTAELLARITALGWFVEVYATGQMWTALVDPLERSGARVLIAHLGEPDVHQGLDQPGFQAVLRLGRETPAVIKLSAPFRVSRQLFPHGDVEPFVAALLEAFGTDRCVWGSDWPFLDVPQRVQYPSLLTTVERWIPDPGDRDRILWRNPARLFGFTGRG